jgi:integrase/recombinase XerD
MLKRLFPKVHARYAASANGALLGDFAVWLVSAGYARDAAHGHVRRLKQALERMSSAPLARDAGISAGFVSQAFASLQTQAPFQGTRRAFERFLAAHGQLLKESDPNRFAPLLDRYRRFCFEQVAVPERLDRIDAPRVYRGELPPRALAWPLVQRLLRSIDRRSRLGWRDYAILHLMAHYGLRPSEIVTLTLGSIDWQAKTLRVKQCKTRSDLVLPLAGQTMRMLRRYLYRGRPGGARPELFLRARTPAGPLTHCAIGDLYQKRARESGLPLQGTSSYCLRHSFAMRLLDRGVGVKVIGDLLGHRTLESTCVYLRLQTGTLREVALPLPAPVTSIVEGAA